MFDRTRKLIAAGCAVLTRDTIPVWLSLALMVLGALATYLLAPMINAQFEIQAARREFLVKNLENFSNDTKSLIDVVAKSVNETSQVRYNSMVSEINPSIAKLQFSATQLLYIVPEHSPAIVDFQKTLDSLQDSILSFRVGSQPQEILSNSKDLMVGSLVIYEALLQKAGFGDSISNRKE